MAARLRRLLRNKDGNTLIMLAAALPLLIAASAIGVDTIQVTVAKRQLQREADSAALAGAYSARASEDVNAAVTRDLEINGTIPLSASPTVQNAPATGPYAGNNRAVRVVLTAQRSVPFIGFFTGSSMDIQVEATAAAMYSGQFCVVSLENTAVTGISFSGSTQVNLGCGVSTNSSAAQAVTADGSSQVTASPIAAVGGVASSGSYIGDTILMSGSYPQSDPFANLANPTVPSPCQPELRVQPTDNITISPGCYRGMDIKGTVNMQPGTYVINGGVLAFGSQANVTGAGVTFVLTSSNATSDPSSIATISMHGGAVLNISAPATGDYAGVLMYQDRRAPLNNSFINGNTASSFQGAFYFPSQQLTFNGNTGMHTECIQFVARRMVFTGNSSVQNSCPANSGAKAFDAFAVRLVG